MTIIGRRGGTKVYIPNSRNTMATRAAKQLEAHARAQGEKYSNALQVDAPMFYFWHNQGGSVPCSCMSKNRFAYAKPINPGEKDEPYSGELLPRGKNKKISSYKPLGLPPNDKYGTVNEDTYSRLTNKTDPKLFEHGDYSDEDSITKAFADSDSSNTSFDPDDPFGIFNRKMITCSVCLGAGNIDAWQLNDGARVVFDTSNVYKFVAHGPEIDVAQQPTLLSFKGDSKDYVIWRYNMPLIWDLLLRTRVYNNDQIVPETMYEWKWTTADRTRTGSVIDDLDELRNYGDAVYIQLTALADFQMTHCEIIFAFSQPKKAQLPDIQKTYEDEFPDYQISVTAELPIGMNIKEGDYLTDSKYNRVWKINGINRRITAGLNEFGVSAELRGLMPFEQRFYQLALFNSPDNDLIRRQKVV